eukprot:GILJ01004714.1.p1 GENE.GILJ01004714.1~~GILJ01004714.1.p1  ORF type:complete len:407 (+),score=45.72 GILJ01004714.1:46-1266(+)
MEVLLYEDALLRVFTFLHWEGVWQQAMDAGINMTNAESDEEIQKVAALCDYLASKALAFSRLSRVNRRWMEVSERLMSWDKEFCRVGFPHELRYLPVRSGYGVFRHFILALSRRKRLVLHGVVGKQQMQRVRGYVTRLPLYIPDETREVLVSRQDSLTELLQTRRRELDNTDLSSARAIEISSQITQELIREGVEGDYIFSSARRTWIHRSTTLLFCLLSIFISLLGYPLVCPQRMPDFLADEVVGVAACPYGVFVENLLIKLLPLQAIRELYNMAVRWRLREESVCQIGSDFYPHNPQWWYIAAVSFFLLYSILYQVSYCAMPADISLCLAMDDYASSLGFGDTTFVLLFLSGLGLFLGILLNLAWYVYSIIQRHFKRRTLTRRYVDMSQPLLAADRSGSVLVRL